MKELKQLSDKQLASRIVSYIERLDEIDSMLSELRKDSHYDCAEMQLIQLHYSQLKKDILADAKYLNTGAGERNEIIANLYNGFFMPSICAAAAYGLKAPINSHNISLLADAVSEARYRMTKYCSLSSWKSIMDKE